MRLNAHNHHIKKIEIKSQLLHYNNRLGKGYFVKKTKEFYTEKIYTDSYV